MDCRKIDRKIVAWLCDELPIHQRAGIGTHVEACESCARRTDELRWVLETGKQQLDYQGSVYSFHMFKARLHTINSLEEVCSWIPVLRVIHPLPRVALAALCLFIAVSAPLFQSRVRHMHTRLTTPLYQYQKTLHEWEHLALGPTHSDAADNDFDRQTPS